MLTQKVKDVLSALCEKEGYSLPSSDDEYLEVLWECGEVVKELPIGYNDKWDPITVVREFDLGLKGIYYIGYDWAYNIYGDNVFDLGWLFDINTIELYEPRTVTWTTYIRVKD